MVDKKHEMDIYKHSENMWAITTNDDRVLILRLEDGELEFYRLTEIDDVS